MPGLDAQESGLRPFVIRVHINSWEEALFTAGAFFEARWVVCQLNSECLRLIALSEDTRVTMEVLHERDHIAVVPPGSVVFLSGDEVVGARQISWFEFYSGDLPGVSSYRLPGELLEAAPGPA